MITSTLFRKLSRLAVVMPLEFGTHFRVLGRMKGVSRVTGKACLLHRGKNVTA